MLKQLTIAATFLAVAAFALPGLAAEDPTGTWKWNSTRGDKTIESTGKLKLEGDKLTGVYVGRNNMEIAITNASFKDNTVKFDVPIEFNGNKITIKYNGTLSGDTIKGKVEVEGGNQSQPRDWEAKRQK